MLSWYGERYPTFQDLERVAAGHKVPVAFHYDFDCPRFYFDGHGQPWFIGIPQQFGPLARIWALAHEVGHLVLHDGPACREAWLLQEAEADAWAAGALIPEARVRHYRNPSLSAFIAALSKNYQPVPSNLVGIRKLAVLIASRRLDSVEAFVGASANLETKSIRPKTSPEQGG